MLASFLLSLREGLEAALIIGILLGALRKFNRPDLTASVWLGAGSAAVVSILAAVILNLVGAAFEGRAEQLFEGITMILAAALLTWMIFWMKSRARTLKTDIENDVRRAAGQKMGKMAPFLVSFLAVVREGVELALFLTAVTMNNSPRATIIGALIGLAGAAALGWLLFKSTIRLNLGRFFQVTSFILIIFAAGLLAHGVHEFNEAGIIPPVIEHVWDINHVVNESSFLGEVLKSLFGYNGNPSLTEVVAYAGYFIVLWGATRPRPAKAVQEPA